MISAVTKSPEDTRQLAAAVAALALPGDIVLLAGDLGAGKTTFAQGFGRGLGVKDHITSPTFILVRSYEGDRMRMVHADVYRLDQLAELSDLGLSELVDEGAVVVVEWGDVVSAALSPSYLEVTMRIGLSDHERRLQLVASGPTWLDREGAVAEAAERWLESAR